VIPKQHAPWKEANAVVAAAAAAVAAAECNPRLASVVSKHLLADRRGTEAT
jgi:hypothetical protein